jgi:chorismate mutase
MRGIRGAIDARENTAPEIEARTQALLRAIVEANRLRARDIAAAFFTMTPDLNAQFPAAAARKFGWTDVPMICASEVAVPGSMPRVIRVLVLAKCRSPRHQYLGGTPCLRPDLAKPEGRARKSSRPNSRNTRTSAGGTR